MHTSCPKKRAKNLIIQQYLNLSPIINQIRKLGPKRSRYRALVATPQTQASNERRDEMRKKIRIYFIFTCVEPFVFSALAQTDFWSWFFHTKGLSAPRLCHTQAFSRIFFSTFFMHELKFACAFVAFLPRAPPSPPTRELRWYKTILFHLLLLSRMYMYMMMNYKKSRKDHFIFYLKQNLYLMCYTCAHKEIIVCFVDVAARAPYVFINQAAAVASGKNCEIEQVRGK